MGSDLGAGASSMSLSVASISLAPRNYAQEERQRKKRLFIRVPDPDESAPAPPPCHIQLLLDSCAATPQSASSPLDGLRAPGAGRGLEGRLRDTIRPQLAAVARAGPDLDTAEDRTEDEIFTVLLARDQEEAFDPRPSTIAVPLLPPRRCGLDNWDEDSLAALLAGCHSAPARDEQQVRLVEATRARLFRPSWHLRAPAQPAERASCLGVRLSAEASAHAFTAREAAAAFKRLCTPLAEWLPPPKKGHATEPELVSLDSLLGGLREHEPACSPMATPEQRRAPLASLASARQRSDRLRKLTAMDPLALGVDQPAARRLWLGDTMRDDLTPAPSGIPTLEEPLLPYHLEARPRPEHLVSLESLLAGQPPQLLLTAQGETATGIAREQLSAQMARLIASVMRGMGPRLGLFIAPSEEALATSEGRGLPPSVQAAVAGRDRDSDSLATLLLPTRPTTPHAQPGRQGRSAPSVSAMLGARTEEVNSIRQQLLRPTLPHGTPRRRRVHSKAAVWQAGAAASGRLPPVPSEARILRQSRDAAQSLSRKRSAPDPSPPWRSPARPRLLDVGEEEQMGDTAEGLHREPAGTVAQETPSSPWPRRRQHPPSPRTTHCPTRAEVRPPAEVRRLGLVAANPTPTVLAPALDREWQALELDESLADSVSAYFAAKRGGPAAGRTEAASAARPGSAAMARAGEEALVVKLEKAAKRGGVLAVLPESVSHALPMLAAALLHALVPHEHASALWLLPYGNVAEARQFWLHLGSSIEVRELSEPPGTGREPPLERGEVGLLALESIAAVPASGAPAPCAAPLVVATLSPPDLPTCGAIGRFLSAASGPQLVALVCGLPDDDAQSLLPMCKALGATHLHLRSGEDADVIELARQRRVHSFGVPRALALVGEELCELAENLLHQAQRRMEGLAGVALCASALRQAIDRFPRGGDSTAFKSLLACLCARQASESIGHADAAGFRSLLDGWAKSLKHQSACRPHPALASLVEGKEAVASAIARVDESMRRAVRAALGSAIDEGFGSARSGGVAGEPLLRQADGQHHGAAARHGVIGFASQRLLPAVRSECEQALRRGSDAEAGLSVQVVAVDEGMEPQHVLNLIQRSRQMAGGGGTGAALLLLLPHDKLLQFDVFPWAEFRLYIEANEENVPPLHLRAQLLQPLLSVHILRPYEAPDAPGDEGAVGGEPSDGVAPPETELPGGKDGPAASEALREAARLLRRSHGGRYDDSINLEAVHARKQGSAARSDGSGSRRGDTHPSGAGAIPWPVMIGEALLEAPRLHRLLRRKGLQLIETSSPLPHLFLDPSSGLLACDAPALLRPEELAKAVSLCESRGARTCHGISAVAARPLTPHVSFGDHRSEQLVGPRLGCRRPGLCQRGARLATARAAARRDQRVLAQAERSRHSLGPSVARPPAHPARAPPRRLRVALGR